MADGVRQNARPRHPRRGKKTLAPGAAPQMANTHVSAPQIPAQTYLTAGPSNAMYQMQDGTSTATFASLKGSVDDRLLSALDVMNFKSMSPVQEKVLKNLATFRSDCLVQAKTGTGKTIAFLLPALHSLLRDPTPPGKVGILVISPTRELAEQIAKDCDRLTTQISPHINCQTAYGGTARNAALKKFKAAPPAVLVATPGRLHDILSTEPDVLARFSYLKTLVLDEADTMLDTGFMPAIKSILSLLPRKSDLKWQGMCFSATMPPKVKEVMSVVLRPDYTAISTIDENEEPTHKTVPQFSVVVPGIENMFTGLLAVLQHELKTAKKAIIFGPTANLVALFHDVYKHILGDSISVFELHSRLTQPARAKTTAAYKDAESALLFASDVVGRGLDFPNVDLVVQVGVPKPKEQYVHRVGRTGRAGKSGRAILLLDDREAFWPNRNRDFPIKPMPNALQDSITDAATGEELRGLVGRAMAGIDAQTKQKAYKSYLGGMVNSGLLKDLKLDKAGLVEMTNRLALQGMGCSEIPGVTKQFVGKAGFKGVPGLRIVTDVDEGGPRQGGRGFGQGGQQNHSFAQTANGADQRGPRQGGRGRAPGGQQNRAFTNQAQGGQPGTKRGAEGAPQGGQRQRRT